MPRGSPIERSRLSCLTALGFLVMLPATMKMSETGISTTTHTLNSSPTHRRS